MRERVRERDREIERERGKELAVWGAIALYGPKVMTDPLAVDGVRGV